MSCNKKCHCKNCEMLMENENITLIKGNGFNEIRHHINGVKCMYTGMYALSIDELKTSKIMDDLIYLK